MHNRVTWSYYQWCAHHEDQPGHPDQRVRGACGPRGMRHRHWEARRVPRQCQLLRAWTAAEFAFTLIRLLCFIKICVFFYWFETTFLLNYLRQFRCRLHKIPTFLQFKWNKNDFPILYQFFYLIYFDWKHFLFCRDSALCFLFIRTSCLWGDKT